MFSDVLLTVDYDRTLTGPDGTIPQRNLDAIRWFMENGGAFTVNTGRSIPMCREHMLTDLPLSAPLLLYNGSAAYDREKGEFTRCSEIDLDPRQVLPALQERFPDMGVEVQGVYAHYLMHRDAGWEDYCTNQSCPWAYTDPGDIPGPFLKFSLYGPFRGNTVANMYEGTPEDFARMEEAMAYVEETYGEKVDVFRACPRIIDVHAKGCNKLRSARLLQQEMGRKILVCVGDGENDLTMLHGADFAYCPGDAIVADRFENVCNCGDGAVADVIFNKIPWILQNKP